MAVDDNAFLRTARYDLDRSGGLDISELGRLVVDMGGSKRHEEVRYIRSARSRLEYLSFRLASCGA